MERELNDARRRVPPLEQELKQTKQLLQPLRNDVETRNTRIRDLERELHVLQQKTPAFQNTIKAREARIRELERLLKEAKKVKPTPVRRAPAKRKTTAKKRTAKRKMASFGLKKPAGKTDDLKLISGVGKTLEKTLHKRGIYYFRQIAGFTRKDVTAVDDMLSFKGRIDRDEWIKQARILMKGGSYTRTKKVKRKTATKKRRVTKRKTKMKAFGMKKPVGRKADDLKLISGVGKVLERTLHRKGIYFYQQIAGFSRKDVRAVDDMLSFKGRIDRDKWIAQAKKLHKQYHKK